MRLKSQFFVFSAMLFMAIFNSALSANNGLTVGDPIPNPEFSFNIITADGKSDKMRLYDFKKDVVLLIAFMPDVSDKNKYADVMTSSFETYFAEGLAFRGENWQALNEKELVVLVVTNNNRAEVDEYLTGRNIYYEIVADDKMDFANSFGINKWNSENDGSHVYIVNEDNKIAYANHDYKGEGEKLKTVQKELFTALGVKETDFQAAQNNSPLIPGDDARDFSFSYANTDYAIHNPDIFIDAKLSDYIGKKNVIIAFYPAPFSMSCAMEVRKFDYAAEEQTLQNVANSNLLDAGDLEILMISVSNTQILDKWKKEMNIKNVKLVPDYGEISAKYNSYNSLGWSNRTLFIINKEGKVSYIDWDYQVDDKDFSLVKDHLLSMN